MSLMSTTPRFKPGGYTYKDFQEGFQWQQVCPETPIVERLPEYHVPTEEEVRAQPSISAPAPGFTDDGICRNCGMPEDDKIVWWDGGRYRDTIKVGALPGTNAHDLKALLSKRGYVYFVQYGGPEGLIKIGRASNLHERFRGLQGMSPIREIELLGYILGASKERSLHKRFYSHHSHFEFFKPHPDLLQYIKDNARKPPSRWPTFGPNGSPTRESLVLDGTAECAFSAR